jgi:hypothetical protein
MVLGSNEHGLTKITKKIKNYRLARSSLRVF